MPVLTNSLPLIIVPGDSQSRTRSDKKGLLKLRLHIIERNEKIGQGKLTLILSQVLNIQQIYQSS